tara:strand:- start:1315 stop:2223 length:909 start_codon:yes stop_codon:yes gene_type:complete
MSLTKTNQKKFKLTKEAEKALLFLQSCDNTSNCSKSRAPTRIEIEEFAKMLNESDKIDIDLPIEFIIELFNKITNMKGGVGSDDEEEEEDIRSASGYTQDQQDIIVNSMMLLASGATALGVAVGSWVVMPAIEPFLVERGIMEPLCKGMLHRGTLHTLRQIDPTGLLAGQSCSERMDRALELYNWAMGRIATVGGTLSLANWRLVHRYIRAAVFGSLRDQKRAHRRRQKNINALPPGPYGPGGPPPPPPPASQAAAGRRRSRRSSRVTKSRTRRLSRKGPRKPVRTRAHKRRRSKQTRTKKR